jgi:hypothetical protein
MFPGMFLSWHFASAFQNNFNSYKNTASQSIESIAKIIINAKCHERNIPGNIQRIKFQSSCKHMQPSCPATRFLYCFHDKIRIYFMSFIVQISSFVHLFTLKTVFPRPLAAQPSCPAIWTGNEKSRRLF